MLHGALALHGYDWWWHSFTAQDAETGEDKPFFTLKPYFSRNRSTPRASSSSCVFF